MKTLSHNFVSPESCREAVYQFWNSQVIAETTPRGVIMALPLMYPDGWQVHVHIEPVSQSRAIITDQGRTLAKLHENGLNCEAKQTAALLDERKRTFELQQNGFELFREIHLPVEGIDVQLFAESLVSIAHLMYRQELTTTVESAAEKTLKKVFKERDLQPATNYALDGEIEKGIRVDYFLMANHPFACQVVKRRGPLLGYVEQWAWRWTDLKKHNPRLLNAMVYDPDKQEWDDTTLSIGKSVCDLFCPYFETDQIHDVLDRAIKHSN
jgi:hypothetical protein